MSDFIRLAALLDRGEDLVTALRIVGNDELSLVDGSGTAKIAVDTDLEITFADGTVKTITTNP